MVDVGGKDVTQREAVARAAVRMKASTRELLLSGEAPKGDVLATARIAGIQAAKRTAELIPLCHNLNLTSCEVHFDTGDDPGRVDIEARVVTQDRTGVEMEALTAAAVAALTLYDMLKAVDRGIVIESVALHEKSGGRSGHYKRV